jgi:hypothetical protein
MVETLLGVNVDPDPRASDGHSPLHLASVSGHQQVVKTLLPTDDRVDVNAKDALPQVLMSPPLMRIIEITLCDTPEVTLSHLTAAAGRTALHCAARNGHVSTVRTLLSDSFHRALGYAAVGRVLCLLLSSSAALPYYPHPRPRWQSMEIGSLARSVGDLFGSNLTFWPVLPMVNKDGDWIAQRRDAHHTSLSVYRIREVFLSSLKLFP